ncbi:hypothetical protein JHFBIEKO_2860 [Methylobacterium mesophilicum]|nr:hypothetical protein JHFBIEKO_2860 [Methylobacterium mesophilicum]
MAGGTPDQVTTWFGVTDISMVMPAGRTGRKTDCEAPKTRTSKARTSIQHCLRVTDRLRRSGAGEQGWPIVVMAIPGLWINEVLTYLFANGSGRIRVDLRRALTLWTVEWL